MLLQKSLSKESNDFLNHVIEVQKKALRNPRKLVKLRAGNYCVAVPNGTDLKLYLVSDDSRERSGDTDWVVRDENLDYVFNYRRLKDFARDWGLTR